MNRDNRPAEGKRHTEGVVAFGGWHDRVHDQPRLLEELEQAHVGHRARDFGIDAVLGVAKDAWTAQVTVTNLTDSDSATSLNSGQYIKQVVPLRPRVITFGMGYNF